MRSLTMTTLMLWGVTMMVPGSALGLEASPQATAFLVQGALQPSESSMPLYKPRRDSIPKGRTEGPARGSGGDAPVVQVLAPDHVGFTRKKDPALYWYLSSVTAKPIEFTLMDTRGIKPVIETRIPAPAQPGVQVVRLKDLGQTLEPGVQYKWYVSVILDPESPSGNLIAGGTIERVPFLEAMTLFSPNGGPDDKVGRLAFVGLWYDAIQEVSEQIEAAPNDKPLREQRACLLSQVRLPDVAQYDLSRIGGKLPSQCEPPLLKPDPLSTTR